MSELNETARVLFDLACEISEAKHDECLTVKRTENGWNVSFSDDSRTTVASDLATALRNAIVFG